MIFVIQCAGSKADHAGVLRQKNGSPVMFVANPKEMPDDPEYVYAHPDDLYDSGVSWRKQLLDYNRNPGDNPLNLLPAWRLYRNLVYRRLVTAYGAERVYILSAGWGLINAEFLTPNYNITFSTSGSSGNRRNRNAHYRDLCLLPQGSKDPIVFFGGKNYVPLFCKLTQPFDCRKIVFYNSKNVPPKPGYEFINYNTRRKTNWHYQCAKDFIDGKISI